jgi:biopolymer transport protein ExbB/TolQ
MTAEDITNREVVEQEKRQAWISRGINILWAVIVASIATYVTIRVTLAEVQSQVRENREMLRALETREEQTAKTVRALELSDGGDRVRQEEIYRRLDRIDASNEKVMELLGQMMARRNTK